MPPGSIICRFIELPDATSYLPGLDAVFFQSSNIQSFADDAARQAFRERWLGRYLVHDPEWAYLALTEARDVAGYLVGSLSDPARTPRFADIAYFRDFREATARYPAHLHVNLLAPFRNAGMGSRLIETFASAARKAGAPGVHVVTGSGARNLSFYARNGFAEVARWGDGRSEVVFLGRPL